MRNFALEAEISAQARNLAGPLSYWRLLPASTFNQHRVVVETALVSIVSISRLAPDELIGELAYALEEERIDVWNDLCVRFTVIDRMAHGVAAEISGSFAALSASQADPLGFVLLLNRLCQPFTPVDLGQRISVASSWLAAHGTLLNPTTLADVDWQQSHRYPSHSDDDDCSPVWEGLE